MNSHLMPDGIGPHEDAEYQLMIDGKKHLAMFSDLIPDEFIDDPAELHIGVVQSDDGTCTVYYMPGHEEAAERLLALNLSSYGKGFVPEIEREIGRLLGYEDWQIDAFLTHVGATPTQEPR